MEPKPFLHTFAEDQNIPPKETRYYINLQRFIDYSTYAKINIKEDGHFPVKLTDSLDDFSFSSFVQYLNDPNSEITPPSVIPLIKASLIYDCTKIFDAVQNFLLSPSLIDLDIQVLLFAFNARLVMEKLEAFVSYNISLFINNPNFTNIPPIMIYRICSWYNPSFAITPDIINFFFKMVSIYGPSATLLFLIVDFSMLHPDMLLSILNYPGIDTDTVGPLILKHLQKADEDMSRIQETISTKTNQIASAHAEKDRLSKVYEQTEQRSRLLTQRLSDLQSKRDQIIEEINKYDAECQDLSKQIDEVKQKTAEYKNEKARLQQEKKKIKRDTEECNEAIATLKQQIADRELQKQAEIQAAEVTRKAEEAKKLAEEKKKLDEERRQKEEEEKLKKQQEQQKEEQVPQKSEVREPFKKPILVPLSFNEQELKKQFLNKKDIKLNVVPTPELQYSLDTEDYSRACELEYLWRGVENNDPPSLSSYGTLLYLTDPSATDLATSLILSAAEKNEPYALYNAAALIMNKIICGLPETAAQFIVDAAKQGEPNAGQIVKSLVKWAPV